MIRTRSSLMLGVAAAAGIAWPGRDAPAQSVLLQIRPRIADTFDVRLDQTVEMTGMPERCGSAASDAGDRARRAGPGCAEATRTITTRMEVFSRAVAQSRSRDATTVLTLTDSVRTSMSGGRGTSAPAPRVVRPGTERELRVAADGAIEMEQPGNRPEARAVFEQMPATLPRTPVSVGQKWVREVRIPLTGEPGATGLVRATFQLDSLGRNGDIAFLSIRGDLSHDHTDGPGRDTSGSLTGKLQLDRRLGWITDTRATIELASSVRPQSGEALHVRTRITQRLTAALAR